MKLNLCDSYRLVAFLQESLSYQEVCELTNHLSGCSACSQKLEQLAATPARWEDAKLHLSRGSHSKIAHHDDSGKSQVVPFTIRQIIDLLEPADDPASMGRIGGYEVIGVVGSGAMGVVLKAVDPPLDRIVALKVMNPTLASCGTARHRFAREARAAAGVLHPNVIAIHGVSTDRELPFLVMPYIAGNSLQQRMDRQGPLALAEILRIGSQLAAGLAAAHQKGVIHRDIKPSNVMLDKGVENALITDFGLARTIDDATMTRSGSIAGTPEYMSPEQARGEAVDCASDVFSLASVLYSLSSGTRPFQAKTSFGVLRKITDDEPLPIRQLNPEIPKWLCKFIEEMHAKSPEARPASAEVHDLLVACLAHVYQPDSNPLPDRLVKDASPKKPVFSKLSLIGAFTMSSLIFAAIVFAAVQSGNYSSEGVATFASKSSSGTDTDHEPTVFKTLNLSFPNQNGKGKLTVDINRGFIEVVSHDQKNVVIEILTPPRFAEVAQDKNGESEFEMIFTPKYDLYFDEDNNSIELDTYNQDYVLNLRIKVPYQTDLSLDSYRDGYLEVKNVRGFIDTHSEHNDIRLSDIEGGATAYSRNGDLAIRFKEVAVDAKLDFESYNGPIDLTLPESIAATTAISSGTGSVLTAFSIESIKQSECPNEILSKVKTNSGEYQFGKINGGGIPLRIESEKGTIKIRKTEKQSP